MITQLIRVRNAMVSINDPKAYGYIVGRVPSYQWNRDDMIIAWEEGTVENERDHLRNVAHAPPTVFLTNST